MEYRCDICTKVYSTNFNRLKHMRKVHDETLYLKKSNINCLECKKTFNYLKDLRSHLNLVHDMSEKISVLQFKNFGEFKTWKRKEEIATDYQYVAIRGAIHLANGCIKKEFVCHRSGFEKRHVLSTNSSKRHHSYKLNATCPASIEATMKRDGSVDVTFNYIHTDHGKDIKYLAISREERAIVGTKLAEGYNFNEILEYIKSLSGTSELSARFFKLTRKDLHNIKNYFLLHKSYELDETNGEFRSVSKEQYAHVNDRFIERDIQKNHKQGCRIKNTDIIEHSENRLVWNIKSQEVKMLKPLMCDCNVKCSICKVCVHMFHCNCYEASSNEQTICSHIHALVINFFSERNSFIRTYVSCDDNSATILANNILETNRDEMKENTIISFDQNAIELFENNNDNVAVDGNSSEVDDIIVYSSEFDDCTESDHHISYLPDYVECSNEEEFRKLSVVE